MLLALDFDETYTRDPEFWNRVIALAQSRGHSVICATMRADVPYEADEVRVALQGRVEAIIFTNRKAKHGVVHAAGYMPSIWIDDNPNWIFTDAK
jgi:hypothetical protein